jgi:hypothetical protein
MSQYGFRLLFAEETRLVHEDLILNDISAGYARKQMLTQSTSFVFLIMVDINSHDTL